MARKENTSIIKRPGDKSKVYSHEPYAQELYDRLMGLNSVSKDLSQGDVMQVMDMNMVNDNEVEIRCNNYDSLFFSLEKEKKYLELLGLSKENFKDWIKTDDCKTHFELNKTYVLVENVSNRKGSLYSAHLKTIVKEFKDEIAKPTKAYSAKVISKNQGGFLVEVQGIKAFLPGSLAAANKIINFDDYIGKEIYVMIEDYLNTSNIFVVSYKKYLEYILPSKLAELERNERLAGTVTGTSKFGIFIEIKDIFTGLLHYTEMNDETQEKFNSGLFKPGAVIETWLKDIKDNRLILTEIDPSIKQNEMEDFREKTEGNIKYCQIVSLKPHGALLELEKGILGLLPVKEMKKSGRRLNVGESIEVFVKKVDTATGKIYLTLNDECLTT